MGKGGESVASLKSSIPVSRLSILSDEELNNWADAYGIKEKMNREQLITALNSYADGILDRDRPRQFPLEPPKFTMKTIIDAIPSHCFKRNLFKSLRYLFSDILTIAIFGYLATYFSHPSLPSWSKYILWPIYFYAQGCVMTGVWVLAHECGHQSFSESELVNNIVGTICHSALLVPYHSWRITHGKHHNNTGSCENDEVFTPVARSDFGEALRDTPLSNVIGLIVMFTVGWMPGYLVFNFTGPKKYIKENSSHFSPTAVFFSAEDYWLIVQSVSAFTFVCAIIVLCIYQFGISAVACFYLVPLFVTNYHLVISTYLQHTDVFMPHFRGKEWTWLRGAMCTVDRSYGPLVDYTMHHINNTHVCHHLFSKMPFYHAQEATEHIRRVLGPYYMKDDTPILRALWRAFSSCQFVEDEGDIVFYKNK